MSVLLLSLVLDFIRNITFLMFLYIYLPHYPSYGSSLYLQVDKISESFEPVAENASDLYSRAQELNDNVNTTFRLINGKARS